MRDVVWGLVLTAGVTGLSALAWGRDALLPAASFGLLALLIHMTAVTLLKPALKGTFNQLLARWAMGMGLRLLGVVAFALAVFLERETFAPLPSAVGYVGVLLPLLFSEMRLIR